MSGAANYTLGSKKKTAYSQMDLDLSTFSPTKIYRGQNGGKSPQFGVTPFNFV